MPYRLTKIYTRTGDDGKTNLGGKKRIAKNMPRIEAIGTLDELNSAIGLVLSLGDIPNDVYSCLDQIQHTLFDMGGELCPPHHEVIHAQQITDLEKIIDHWNTQLLPLKEFILPRGNPMSAACHLARTICRRAERRLVTLNEQESINPEMLRYVNRLSDVLFVASRMLAKEAHCPEELWKG